MRNPDGRAVRQATPASNLLREALGGRTGAIDLWTRVDGRVVDTDVAGSLESVFYRGLTAPYRVAGLTLGDADAAPFCPQFAVEIHHDRLRAEVCWPQDGARPSLLAGTPLHELTGWAAGSLTKALRVAHLAECELALDAELHLPDSIDADAVREFVTAFSWDVAALYAADCGAGLVTTEKWVQRAALSISRSTPHIPLRPLASPGWQAHETPQGVFCSLEPGGGLCASDNVLYIVRRDDAVLEPLAAMPGHRTEWDCARLTDVWLARDGATAFARTLLCDGMVTTGDGIWRPVHSDPVTAVAPWSNDGFLLGLHDGRVTILDGNHEAGRVQRIARLTGSFRQLVAAGDRAVGLVNRTVFAARLSAASEAGISESWSVRLDSHMSIGDVADIDVDRWAQSPAVAVLGDDTLLLLDAATGAERVRFATPRGTHARWIGPGWLMVLHEHDHDGTSRTAIRLLDVTAGRWTSPVLTPLVARLAVRGDEIHVGYATQTIAVWNRVEVCDAIGTSSCTVGPSRQLPGARGGVRVRS